MKINIYETSSWLWWMSIIVWLFAVHNFLTLTCIRKLLPISREASAMLTRLDRYRTIAPDGFNKALFDCPISSSLLYLIRTTRRVYWYALDLYSLYSFYFDPSLTLPMNLLFGISFSLRHIHTYYICMQNFFKSFKLCLISNFINGFS